MATTLIQFGNRDEKTPVYSVEFTEDEAALLNILLSMASDPRHPLSPNLAAKMPHAISAKKKLRYSPPQFPVGTRVVRTRVADEDERVYTVEGHIWNGPGNWTAWLGDFGVGEVYLDFAPLNKLREDV